MKKEDWKNDTSWQWQWHFRRVIFSILFFHGKNQSFWRASLKIDCYSYRNSWFYYLYISFFSVKFEFSLLCFLSWRWPAPSPLIPHSKCFYIELFGIMEFHFSKWSSFLDSFWTITTNLQWMIVICTWHTKLYSPRLTDSDLKNDIL